MNKLIIIQFLATHGVQFANEATDEEVSTALKALGTKAKTAETLAAEKVQWANEKNSLTGTITARDNSITQLTAERDTAQVNFANERKNHIAVLVGTALTDGRITAAEKPQWETRLGNQVSFVNEAEALSKLTKKVKTESLTLEMGGRKVEIANSNERREAVSTLVKTEMETGKCDYSTAYGRVQQKNPALFEAMAQPKIQTPK